MSPQLGAKSKDSNHPQVGDKLDGPNRHQLGDKLDNSNRQQVVDKLVSEKLSQFVEEFNIPPFNIPWGHNIVIIDNVRGDKDKLVSK